MTEPGTFLMASEYELPGWSVRAILQRQLRRTLRAPASLPSGHLPSPVLAISHCYASPPGSVSLVQLDHHTLGRRLGVCSGERTSCCWLSAWLEHRASWCLLCGVKPSPSPQTQLVSASFRVSFGPTEASYCWMTT